MIRDLQNEVSKLLGDLDSTASLGRLFQRVLGYAREDYSVSRTDWNPQTAGYAAEDPMLVATGGRNEQFHVLYTKLDSEKLSLSEERKIIAALSKDHPYALYAFSNRQQNLWHFVNTPYAEDTSRRLYRRITIGASEGVRTATERLAMLSLDELAANRRKEPDELSPLEVQAAHDAAFDVEAVTKQFFDEYRRVFEYVEKSVDGIEDDERRHYFVQRLMNRLMFVAFVQKKGWLKLDGRTDYLPALWDAHKRNAGAGGSFYEGYLRPLFFKGFNTVSEPDTTDPVVGNVPYLNGGLFEEDADDRDVGVTVPDECLDEILNRLFARYNFTTTESTPLDIEVAVDPEMLGRVFEELITERHAFGAYYTPKPIVSFMCREALKGYLEHKLDASSDGDREAVRAFVEDHDPTGLTDPEAALGALREMRVCDPACGSGAYLLGMLRELLDLRGSLFATHDIDPRSVYHRKLEIIQNNIYGVDIDAFAANIARLRLWLSLVVDYEGQNPPPLPNLDFKIGVGDSLTAPDPSGGLSTPDMVRQAQVEEYATLKGEYLKSHGARKTELQESIGGLRAEIAAWAHPGEASPGFDWQVEFAEVFADSGGFDAIVANPPYVRQELIRNQKPRLKQVFPAMYMGTADLYVYFYGRALQLLAEGGVMGFISSNKWFRANYGKKLRKHVADTCHVRSITDFGDLPVFESATAYPMIFTAQKGRGQDAHTLFTEVESLAPPYPDVATLVRQSGEPLPPDAVDGEDWLLTDAETAARLTKMRASGPPLGEYVKGRIYYGIKTGFNTAFVIDGTRREELISQDPKSAEIIKPFATGKDVRKWTVDYKNKWLIVTPIGVNMKRYPAVFEHLKQWQPELEKRYDQGKHWWELRPCDYYPVFDAPKMVFPDIAKKPRFAFDTVGVFTNDTTFVMPDEDLYLLGLLNSSVVENLFIELGATVRGGYLRFKPLYVEQIPIPDASAADRDVIASLVQKCLDAKGVGCERWEREIDGRVAALYGLDSPTKT